MVKSLARLDSPVEGLSPSLGGLPPSLGGLPPSLGGLDLPAGDVSKLLRLRQTLTPKMRRDDIERVIAEMCDVRSFTRLQIADLLSRHEDYVKKLLAKMVKDGILAFTTPEMSTNPHQAYKTIRIPGSKSIQGTLDLQ